VRGRRQDRETLIVEHLSLARAPARRYARRGETVEDLEQVAVVGLINAVDRFDPSRGTDVRSFATPTILGEIRRHFRDRAWTVRVPRGLKDDYARVSSAIETLTARLGRTPSIQDIAMETSLSEDGVLDAIAAHAAYRPQSLSAVPGAEEDGPPPDIAAEEAGYEIAEVRSTLARGLRHLSSREPVILHLDSRRD